MTDQEPDPPLTLSEAERRLSQFLPSGGYPARIRWITADQILLGNDEEYFIRAAGSEVAFVEAQRRYDVGLQCRLGISIQAICAAPTETIASVYIPTDTIDAQYRMIRSGLKLSYPTTIIPATMIQDPAEWHELELDTRTRSRMLREMYDL